MGDIRDKRILEDNQCLMGLESQGYLFSHGSVVFGADYGEYGLDSIVQMAIMVDDDIIKIVLALDLLPGSCDTIT